MVTQGAPQELVPMGLHQESGFAGPAVLEIHQHRDLPAPAKQVGGCLTQRWHGPRQAPARTQAGQSSRPVADAPVTNGNPKQLIKFSSQRRFIGK